VQNEAIEALVEAMRTGGGSRSETFFIAQDLGAAYNSVDKNRRWVGREVDLGDYGQYSAVDAELAEGRPGYYDPAATHHGPPEFRHQSPIHHGDADTNGR
jgi:hypothetical protein